MRSLRFALALVAACVLPQTGFAQQGPTDPAVPAQTKGSSYQLVSNSGQGFDFTISNGYSVTSAVDSNTTFGTMDSGGFLHVSASGSVLCNWVLTIKVNGPASAFTGSYVQWTVTEDRWTSINLQSQSAGDAYVQASGGEAGEYGTSIDQYQGGAADAAWSKHDSATSLRHYLDIALHDVGDGTCEATFTLPGNTLSTQARLTYYPQGTSPYCGTLAKSQLVWNWGVWVHGTGGGPAPVGG